MSKINKQLKQFKNSKSRLAIILGSSVALVSIVVVVMIHFSNHSTGSAKLVDAPKIDSIPGSSNASQQYVDDQKQENIDNAAKARENNSSSVPTITRPSFVGNPADFANFGDKKESLSSGDQAANCPLKKLVVMYKPNPASCTAENLKLARKTGVTAEELLCQGCSCPALKLAGYTVGDLKNIGLTAKQLKKCGFTLNELVQAGFSADELKDAGYSAKELADAGFSAAQLADAGYSSKDLSEAGFSPSEIAAAISSSSKCSVDDLKKKKSQGMSAAELKEQGCGLAALKAAGFTAKELKDAGFSAKALKDAGFTAKDLKAAGFSAKDLKDAGYSPSDLVDAGYSDQDLQAAGLTPSEIAAAKATSKKCSVEELKKQRDKGVSAVALKEQGCGLAALKAAGFTARELKDAGFSAKDLKDAGFSATDLKNAGFSASDLKDAGFSASDLKDAGYSAADLKGAGFSAADLKKAGFTAAQLKDAGFSAKALKDAGYSAKALKSAGFTAADLKKAGFSAGALKDAGFDAGELAAAGFSAEELHNAGFTAADLKDAGFTPDELKAAGFTKGDLLRAGFSPEESGYAQSKPSTTNPVNSASSDTPKSLNTVKADSDVKIPSVSNKGDEASQRLRELAERQQKQMDAQQRAQELAQLQSNMTVQAQAVLSAWGQHSSQTFTAAPEDKDSALSGVVDQSTSSAADGKIYKAGTVMFAVLDTSINSDESTPIMATIVSGPLKGSKLLGSFKQYNKKLLLSFNVLNNPNLSKTVSLNSVAIDPDTARTAVAGEVNNHYLLRYGSLFAASFLQGMGESYQSFQSNSGTVYIGDSYNDDPPNATQVTLQGLGQVGTSMGNELKPIFNKAATVKISSGTGLGILIMKDLTIPYGDNLNQPTVGGSSDDKASSSDKKSKES